MLPQIIEGSCSGPRAPVVCLQWAVVQGEGWDREEHIAFGLSCVCFFSIVFMFAWSAVRYGYDTSQILKIFDFVQDFCVLFKVDISSPPHFSLFLFSLC